MPLQSVQGAVDPLAGSLTVPGGLGPGSRSDSTMDKP